MPEVSLACPAENEVGKPSGWNEFSKSWTHLHLCSQEHLCGFLQWINNDLKDSLWMFIEWVTRSAQRFRVGIILV